MKKIKAITPIGTFQSIPLKDEEYYEILNAVRNEPSNLQYLKIPVYRKGSLIKTVVILPQVLQNSILEFSNNEFEE